MLPLPKCSGQNLAGHHPPLYAAISLHRGASEIGHEYALKLHRKRTLVRKLNLSFRPCPSCRVRFIRSSPFDYSSPPKKTFEASQQNRQDAFRCPLWSESVMGLNAKGPAPYPFESEFRPLIFPVQNWPLCKSDCEPHRFFFFDNSAAFSKYLCLLLLSLGHSVRSTRVLIISSFGKLQINCYIRKVNVFRQMQNPLEDTNSTTP